MNKAVKWIRSHQVLTFFLLAYGISWTVLSLYFSIFQGDQNVGVLIKQLAVLSTALMAMYIASILESGPRQESSRPRRIAFFVSWIICASFLMVYGWVVYRVKKLAVVGIVFSILAFFPAWLPSGVFSKTSGIRKNFSTLARPRGPIGWYLLVFLFFLGIPLLGMSITRLLGGPVDFYRTDLPIREAAFLLLGFLHVSLKTGDLIEACCLGGYTLPRLQERYRPLGVSLMIAAIWFPRHVPARWRIRMRGPMLSTIKPLYLEVLPDQDNQSYPGGILADSLAHIEGNISGKMLFPITNFQVVVIFTSMFFIFLNRKSERKVDPIGNLTMLHINKEI